MADKLIVDWKQYNLIVEKLAVQIYQSGFKPDILIGIMRGGAPIIDVLSRILKLKCAYLAVESYILAMVYRRSTRRISIFKRNELYSSRNERKHSFM